MGRDVVKSSFRYGSWEFQSTRPRGARLGLVVLAQLVEVVSIHAPTWGATQAAEAMRADVRFNPRAHVGRDSRYFYCVCFSWCFNPRAHVGRDLFAPCAYFVHINRFNPRAHVGRDVLPCQRLQRAMGFNPRAHVGRDLVDVGSILDHKFQSTRPRGARPLHPHGLGAYVTVSIHAPTWGATPRDC